MSDKRTSVIHDPAAKRMVLATVPFSSLNELIAALQWLKEAPHLNKDAGSAKYPVSIDIDKAGARGKVELCSFSRAATKDNFYGEEVNLAFLIAIKEGGAA